LENLSLAIAKCFETNEYGSRVLHQQWYAMVCLFSRMDYKSSKEWSREVGKERGGRICLIAPGVEIDAFSGILRRILVSHPRVSTTVLAAREWFTLATSPYLTSENGKQSVRERIHVTSVRIMLTNLQYWIDTPQAGLSADNADVELSVFQALLTSTTAATSLCSTTRTGASRNGAGRPSGDHRGRRSLTSLIPYTLQDIRLDRNISISCRNIERQRCDGH